MCRWSVLSFCERELHLCSSACTWSVLMCVCTRVGVARAGTYVLGLVHMCTMHMVLACVSCVHIRGPGCCTHFIYRCMWVFF